MVVPSTLVSTPNSEEPWCASVVASNWRWVVACWKLGSGTASQKKNSGKISIFATFQPHRKWHAPQSRKGKPPAAMRGWKVR